VIVGDGPLRDELLRKTDALGLTHSERLRFVPFEPPSARYLRDLDLFLLSSSWEAMPISILEALACGVPQVASDVGGVGEAVSPETGVLVPPLDSERLADAIVSLLRDPIRLARLSEGSRDRHRRLFGLERMVSETAGVYEDVLRAEGRPSARR